jgi:hypothetical protein
MSDDTSKTTAPNPSDRQSGEPGGAHSVSPAGTREKETGGRAGPDPTRYGDWEKDGRCIDF